MLSKSIRRLNGFIMIFLALAGSPHAQVIDPENDDACAQINRILKNLSKAEHEEATALELFSHGGDSAMVESRLSRLLADSRKLRVALHRAALHSRSGDNGPGARCLKLGYQSLYKAERVSAEVEHVLAARRDSPGKNKNHVAVPPAGSAPARPGPTAGANKG